MTMRFLGYYKETDLPVKHGMTVIIPAGTTVRSFNPSKREWITKRNQRVMVRMIMNGVSYNPLYHKRDDIQRACKDEAAIEAHYTAWKALETAARAETDEAKRLVLMRQYHEYQIPVKNPSVEWAGSGGYWTWVELNDILAANGL